MKIIKQQILTDVGEVEISNWPTAKCGDYTVYAKKVWKITGFQRSGFKSLFMLDREKAKESKWVTDVELPTIIKQTGYIPI